ncbi:MAG: hypothetical protein V3S69_02005 [Dehalococcoidales bacterium]
MTVKTQVAEVTATGNGVARTFSFSPLVINANTELQVITRIIATGVETVRLRGSTATTYSISIPANGYPATGSIDFPASGGTLLPSTEQIIIRRVLTLEQTLVLRQGKYNPKQQETAFDKLVMILIQQQEQMDRSLRLPVSTPSTVDAEAPPPITALTYLRLKSDLTGFEWVELSSTGTAVASSATPAGVALLTAVAGTSADFSRSDHAHLVDSYIKISADIHNALNFI